MFLECPVCDTRYFYDVTEPPLRNTRCNLESAGKVNEARRAVYGNTRSVSLSRTYIAMSGKLRKHVDNRHDADGDPELARWRKERSAIECTRFKNV